MLLKCHQALKDSKLRLGFVLPSANASLGLSDAFQPLLVELREQCIDALV